MRRPRPGDVLQRLGIGYLGKFVGPLDGPADAEVADGQNVLPAEVEHEEHIGTPLAEALDGGYLPDHLVVRQIVKRPEIKFPGYYALREVSEVAHLGPG